jgi:hypothetical protein
MSKPFGSRQQGLDYFPFCVTQVTGISSAAWGTQFWEGGSSIAQQWSIFTLKAYSRNLALL